MKVVSITPFIPFLRATSSATCIILCPRPCQHSQSQCKRENNLPLHALVKLELVQIQHLDPFFKQESDMHKCDRLSSLHQRHSSSALSQRLLVSISSKHLSGENDPGVIVPQLPTLGLWFPILLIYLRDSSRRAASAWRCGLQRSWWYPASCVRTIAGPIQGMGTLAAGAPCHVITGNLMRGRCPPFYTNTTPPPNPSSLASSTT